MEIARPDRERQTNRLLLFACIALLLITAAGWLFSDKPMGGHECFVSVTARNMLSSGDWVVPNYNGQPRLQKTPLNYWVVAAMASVTGGVTDFAARSPSMCLAIISIVAILYFLHRSLGFRVAAFAAIAWLTSLSFFRYGQNARPEMALTALVTISMLSFYAAMTESSRKRQIVYMLIFWISFALAMLAKGPAPLPLIGIPLLAWVAINKKFKDIPKMLPIIGSIIFLAIVLTWPILLAQRLAEASGQTDMIAFWKKEFISRFLGTHDAGDKPFYYYLPVMFQLTAPWSLFVPMALMAPFYKVWDQKRKTMMFLWLWFVGDVIFMSLSGGKRTHYILPAIPALAILIGMIIEDIVCSQKAHTPKFAFNLIALHFFALIAAAVGCGAYFAMEYPAILFVVALTVALLMAAHYCFKSTQKLKAALCFFAAYLTLQSGLFIFVLAPQTNLHYSRQFARNTAALIPADADVIAYKDVTSRFVHYFQRTVPVADTIPTALKQYNDGAWIIAYGPYLEELKNDKRFNVIKQYQRSELLKDNPTPGALFHKDK